MKPKALDSKYVCENPQWLLIAVSTTGRMSHPVRKIIYKPKFTFKRDEGSRWFCTYETKSHEEKALSLDRILCLLPVRCGKCSHCRKLNNDQWAARLIHHSEGFKRVGFLTLTFNDAELAKIEDYRSKHGISVDDNRFVHSLYIRPFLKRLRKYGYLFDYYCVSERGEGGRFHFHLILYFKSPDQVCDPRTGEFRTEPYVDSNGYYHPLGRDVERVNKLTKVYSDEFVLAQRWHWCCKHKVKLPKGKKDPDTGLNFRWQTMQEQGFQLIAEKCWSSVRKYGRSDDYMDIHPIQEYSVMSGKRYTTTEGAYGFVSYFEAEGKGMFKYVTNYTQKCQHDGLDTYHRQSGALGYVYPLMHSFDFSESVPLCVPCGMTSTGSQYTVPTPRYYSRKFTPSVVRSSLFWRYFGNLSQTFEYRDALNLKIDEKSYPFFNSLDERELELDFEKSRSCGITDLGADWYSRYLESERRSTCCIEFPD